MGLAIRPAYTNFKEPALAVDQEDGFGADPRPADYRGHFFVA
jgi:hypothetical protein